MSLVYQETLDYAKSLSGQQFIEHFLRIRHWSVGAGDTVSNKAGKILALMKLTIQC